MGTSCEASKRMALTKGLVQGQELARQLQLLLQKPVGDYGFAAAAADGVLENIVRSFAESIHLITDSSSDHQFGGTNWDKLRGSKRQVSTNYGGDAGSEDSTESKKRPGSGFKHKKGCYKRRKCSDQTWTKVSPTMEDGQAWRKYGQKEILNAKFPRSYFRCTHKYEQGCKATKQVQRIEESPHLLYNTTYIGVHTCKDTAAKGPQLIVSTELEEDHHHHRLQLLYPKTKYSTTAIKEEDEYCKLEQAATADTHSDLTHDNNNNNNNNNNDDIYDNFFQLPDFTGFDELSTSVSDIFGVDDASCSLVLSDFGDFFLDDAVFSS